jgi:alkylated DNA repair dioxygenase AlkB
MKRKQSKLNFESNKKLKHSLIQSILVDRDGARVVHVQTFLSNDEAEKLKNRLIEPDISWRHSSEKDQHSNRLVCTFAANRRSSDEQNRIVQEWIPELVELKNRIEMWINRERSENSVHFGYALLDYYRDEKDHRGWSHGGGNNLELGLPIASINLGETRKFQLKRYAPVSGRIEVNKDLNSGSMIVMEGTCQQLFNCRIPPTKKKKQSNVNITFHCLDGGDK